MKVLLLGDYSSLGINLKEGLMKIGVEVMLAANGDGWKKLPGADTYLFPESSGGQLDKIQKYVIFPRNDNRFRGFDIVHAPGTDIFSWRAGSKPFENIIRNNEKFFLNAAGVDYYLYESWKKRKLKYDYYMFDDNDDLRKWLSGKNISSYLRNYRCRKITEKANGIIPVIPYEYEISYSAFHNLRKPILLPINTDKYEFKENIVKGKVVFFHGINRVKDKGSEYIREAMLRLNDMYPNDVECIIAERMPFNEYVQSMERANVIIDQCKSYGYGLNACIAMAKGKIVLSGAEDEVIKRIDINSCPIINIRPDIEHILRQLLFVLEQKRKIIDIGIDSRKYIEDNHDYIKIAQQYVEEWNK